MEDPFSSGEIQFSIEKTKAPQSFTFKDGTTVKAPFKPNYQQEDALNAMDDFIKSDRTHMTLSGYAGTGKTSLMEMLAKKMKKEHRPIVFSATTNKAAAVLRDRVSKAGFTAQTLNKVFGIQVEVDSSKAYDATNLVPKLKEADIQPGTTVVIDEASMINEQNFDILNNVAKEYGLKIIYVGDEAQLAPVNEDKISKVFRNNEGDVRRLTIVERTDDNAILKEATAVRNGEQLSKESSFNNDGKGVAYVETSNRKEIADIVKAFAPKLKENPDYFRILAYTNDAVSAYNTATRNALGYTDNIPRVGEPIVGYANWGYEFDFITLTSGYKFINSESYKIIKVGSPTEVQKSIENGTIVNLSVLPITIQDVMGKTRNIDFIDIKGNAKNRAAATILAKEKSRLWDVARKARGKEKGAILREINNIDEFLFVNDNIMEGTRTLQSKVFDFGYAMTVHKSQGSTFTHVLLDDVDIAKARNSQDSSWTTMSFDNFSELNFGDLSDMQEVGDFAPTEEMDLFGSGETLIQSMPEQIAQPSTESSDINIRQQLEYVGVSRATDTVTIISNNVKKADSPLNHITVPTKGLKEETKPASKMNSNDIWNTVAQFAQPLGERLITYAPVGKERQTYTVKGEHIYNKEGKEVFRTESKDRNKILANLAISEDRAVVVTHKNSQYVVDNNKEIISVTTGNIMKWGEENGDRRIILNEAAQKFRDIIAERQLRSSEITPELIEQLNEIGKEIGFEVKNRKDIEQYIKNNNLDSSQLAAEWNDVDTDILSNYPTLSGYNLSAFTDHAMQYGTTNNGSGYVIYNGKYIIFAVDNDGMARPIIELEGTNEILNILEYAKQETNNSRDFISRVNETWNNRYGTLEGNSAYFEDRKQYGKNDSKNRKQSGRWRENGLERGSQDSNNHSFFLTPQGEVYGFVAPNNDIYLDETVITPEHPIHEYTHLWDRFVAKKNPELWKRGVNLMKQTSLWQEVLNDSNYGQKWQAMQGMTDNKLESLIASEVHARLVGKEGASLLDKIAKEKGTKKIIGRLKQWILDFWKELKATFSDWSDEEISKLTLEDFNQMTLRDFADKINFNNFENKNNIRYGNDFRRVQETSRRLVQEGKPTTYQRGDIIIDESTRSSLAATYARLLSQGNGEVLGQWVSLNGKGNQFKVAQVNKNVFHDIFEINRNYLKNGELVDLHDNYDNCKCYLTEDGLAGFAIEENGNLVSVFSLNSSQRGGSLYAVKDYIIAEGATHLDAYNSSKQPLRLIYEKVFNAKAASTMDYNMEFDHDDNAANHGSPQVVFMVMGKVAEGEVKEQHFNKDQYDEAEAYQHSFLQQQQNIQQTQKENQPDPVVKALEGQPTETQEKETPVKVDLPGYKAFSLLDEDVEVDASWKVPLLKELDMNFSTENTAEENLSNLEQMNRLLQATSEDEYRKNPTRAQQEISTELSDYDKRNIQVRNLMNSSLIDATEVRHTAEQIVDNISDTITELQENPKKAKEYFPTLNSELDFKTADRKDIVKAIGIDNLIELAKNKFDPEANDYDFDVMEQAELIIDNWDAIIEYASDLFVANEGFGIIRDTKNGRFSTQEKQYVGYDDDNIVDPQDEDAVREEERFSGKI